MRNALIQAGIQLLQSGGVQQLSLREAARIAGVSQAAPYRHFHNKEALMAAIAQEGFVLLQQMLRDACGQFDHNPEELFHQVTWAYLRLALERPDHFRLMFGGAFPLSFTEHPELSRVADSTFHEVVKIITSCQEAGIVRSGNPTELAILLWSTSHGLAHLLMDNRLHFLGILQDQAEATSRMITHHLLAGMKGP